MLCIACREPLADGEECGGCAHTDTDDVTAEDEGDPTEPPRCSICEQPLLLTTPGRTVCERCRVAALRDTKPAIDTRSPA